MRDVPIAVREFISRWPQYGHIDKVEAYESAVAYLYERAQRDAIEDYRRDGKVPRGIAPDPKKRPTIGDHYPAGHDIP